MGERLLVAFVPPVKITKNLEEIREILGEEIQAGASLKTPHITIVDNSYVNIKNVEKALGKIAKTFSPIITETKGIDTFNVNKKLKIEKYAQNNSLIYMIKSNPSMNKLRKEILKSLKPLQTGERLAQWKEQNIGLSKRALFNINKYGTPFSLKEWKFHATVGLIPRKKQKEILNKIQKFNVVDSLRFDKFVLFVRKERWEMVKEYFLKVRV